MSGVLNINAKSLFLPGVSLNSGLKRRVASVMWVDCAKPRLLVMS